MLNYPNFILEKLENLILESINDGLFIFSSELCDILNEIIDSNKEYSKIAKVFLDLDITYHDKLAMSYFDVGSDNQSITYLNPTKVNKIRKEKGWTVSDSIKNLSSKNSIRIGRLVNKVIELHNKKFRQNLVFTPPEIEDFVNAYKSHWDFQNDKMSNLKLISGSLISYWYSENNYHSESGTLGNSCMRHDYCTEYLDIYTHSKSVSMLILLTPENKISGRAIIWKLTDGSLFMDRVYTNDDSDVNLFIKWAEINNCAYKLDQNSRVGNIVKGGKTSDLKLEAKVYSVDYDSRFDEKFPYMDTLKYFYWKEGVLRNWTDLDKVPFVILEDTEGSCECLRCGNDGLIDCEECYGSGALLPDSPDVVDCEKCEGVGQVKCLTCAGFSNY